LTREVVPGMIVTGMEESFDSTESLSVAKRCFLGEL
jgi:hypothetical protein